MLSFFICRFPGAGILLSGKVVEMIKIYAHRGYSGVYPENTMLSFMKAIEARVDGIELDIHYSKDKEIMIQHDEAMKRCTGLEGFIFDYTRSELEKINAGVVKDNEFGFTPIPSFDEYLDYIKDKKITTNVELKTAPVYYDGIEEKAVEMIYKAGLENNIIFSSFNWLSIVRVKKIAPEIPAGLLIDQRLFGMGALLGKEKMDFFHPYYATVDVDAVKDMHSYGVGVNVWTVDEEPEVLSMMSFKVDGIITNQPERVRKIVRNK